MELSHLWLFLSLLYLVSSLQDPPFQEKEEVRVYTNVLPNNQFNRLQQELLPITSKLYKSLNFGTFWFPRDKDPNNIIEEVVANLFSLITGENQDQFQGAEWYYSFTTKI
jgi:hypothetical protein